MASNTRLILFAAVCAALGMIVGICIGHFSSKSSAKMPPREDLSIRDKIMNEIQSGKIEENLRILTEYPHIAGRDVDEKKLVKFVADRFREAGLEVEIHPYDVLLSYPNSNDSNFIAIKLDNGTLIDKSHPNEKILDESQNKSGVVNPFNAYSASGDVEGDPVYVNYGTVEDFQILTNLGINISGKICISRYSKIFRGDKAVNAEKYKCAGLILYSDPSNYAMPGAGVYPDSHYLPGTGAQRGTLLLRGDPLTPHYPAIDTAWRQKEKRAKLPTIPVTPIGYDDAVMYLGKMAGNEVPVEWRGGLNITYRYGPGFQGVYSKSKVKMHVTTSNQMATIHNVIGIIKGEREPDRYVIFGNHRDAWVFGAMDPSGGTAVMLELARAYGEAVREGWRPRRTIIFCSWAAEEYGLIGSVEWVEEYQKVLTYRAVVYLNCDTAVQGRYSLYVNALPNLHQVLYDSTKVVKNPDSKERQEGRNTVYDTWTGHSHNEDNPELPDVKLPTLATDHAMFVQLAGVTAMDISYQPYSTTGVRNPVYHSAYSTFNLVKKYIDPDFKYHRTVGQVWGEIGRQFIDSTILPLNAIDYAKKISKKKDDMLVKFGDKMRRNNINTEILNDAVQNFTIAAKELHQCIDDIDITNVHDVRQVNDQLMQLERSFIDVNGVTGREQLRHVIFTPNKHNSYSGSAFPGLTDSMFGIDADPDPEKRWEEVRRQYSILLYHIGSAASTLRDVVPIKGYSNS